MSDLKMYKFKVGDRVTSSHGEGTVIGIDSDCRMLLICSVVDTERRYWKHWDLVAKIHDDTPVVKSSNVDFLLELGYSITKIGGILKIQNRNNTFYIFEAHLSGITRNDATFSHLELQLTMLSQYVVRDGKLFKSRVCVNELIETYIEGNVNYA